MIVITNQEADNDLKTYIRCMTQSGGGAACYRIECKHGLDGYPPELATVGLKAISEGEDAETAIATYCGEINQQ